MQPSPFLTALKTGVFAILCFLIWMVFVQGNNTEDKLHELRVQTSELKDKTADLVRKVEALSSNVDQGRGAADALARIVAAGGTIPGAPRANDPALGAGPTAREGAWGWSQNETLDRAPDPAKPVGTPGRYRNFLVLENDPQLIPPESRGHGDGVVGMAFGAQEKSFNPLISTSASVQESLDLNVNDAAVSEHWADPYKYGPALCWRVEVSPDFREYTLFFRRDVVWQPPADASAYPHLGGTHAVTARDYKFTIDTIRNPQTECAPLRSYFGDCEGVTLVDDWTVVVRWSKTVYHSIAFTLYEVRPVPEFLYAYDDQGKRFPEETFAQQFNDHYYNRIGTLGCGPYRMLPYDGGEWIVLERFDDWYGAREGRRYPVKTVRLLVYNDTETPLLKFLAQELSILGLSASMWKKFVRDETDSTSPFKDGRIVNYRGMRPGYYYFGWNNTDPLFADRNVRRALALAFRRDEVLEKIWLGYLVPMSSPIFPESPSADPGLKSLPHDPAEAARLLDAAGWAVDPETGIRTKTLNGEKKRFEFEMIWRSPAPEVEATINQYRNDLRALGIVLTTVPLEWSIYLEKAHDRDFQAVLGQWATNAWDMDFEQLWHSKQIEQPKSSNYISFSHPEVDRHSDELRTEMEVEKRKEKARRVGRILFEEQPVCFIGWVNVYGAHWAWLHNAIEHRYKTRPFIRNTPMWTSR